MAKDTERKIIELIVNGQAAQTSMKEVNQEVRKLTAEFRKMKEADDPVAYAKKREEIKLLTAEYRKMQEQLKPVATAVKNVNNEINASSGIMSKMANNFNKYWGVITTSIAALTGTLFAFKKAVTDFYDFQESSAALQSITGVSKEVRTQLEEDAKALSTASLEGSVKVTQSAKDIVDAYAMVGNARPELLKDVEALKSVTREAIILSAASKESLSVSVAGVTGILNQFNLEATESRRVINALAAGSLNGAKPIAYLNESIQISGATAKQFNVTIEESIAVTEVLGKRIDEAGKSGTNFRNILINLETQSVEGFKPSVVGMSQALANLEASHLSAAQAEKIFGKENYTSAQILINNRKEYDNLVVAVTGTNTAIEQAIINTDTEKAAVAQVTNALKNKSIMLGEKLVPVARVSLNVFNKLIDSFISVADWVGRNTVFLGIFIKSITVATVAMVSYTAATKLAAWWSTTYGEATLFETIATKASAIAKGVARTATLLYAAAQAVLTGNILRAQAAMRLLNAQLLLSPIGIVTALVTASVAAYILFSDSVKKAKTELQLMADLQAEAKKNTADEISAIRTLVAIAKDETISKEKRAEAIKKLNEISPEYLGNLNLENIATQTGTDLIDKYIAKLNEKAIAEALQSKRVELNKKLIDAQNVSLGDEVGWLEKSKNYMLNFGNVSGTMVDNIKSGITNRTENIKLINDEIKALDALTKKQIQNGNGAVIDAISPTGTNLNNQIGADKKGAKGAAQDQKEWEKTVERSLENQKKLNDELFSLRQDEITRELVQVSQKYQDEINLANENAKKYPAQAAIFQAEATAATERLKQAQAAIVKKYDDAEAKEKADADQKNLEERKKRYDDFVNKYYPDVLKKELDNLNALHDAGIISEEQYQTVLTQIKDKARKDQQDKDEKALLAKQQKFKEAIEVEQAITSAAASFFSALKEKEIAEAGDNEEAKKEIVKKYALADLLVKESQIAASTAMAIMKAYAEYPPGFDIAASIVFAAAGLAQGAAAKAEYNKIQSMGDGGFTQGPSHREGGVMINAEGGELMLNKRFVANNQAFAASLLRASRINNGNMSITAMPQFDMGGITDAVKSNYSLNVAAPVVNIDNNKMASATAQNATVLANLANATNKLVYKLENLEAKINYTKNEKEKSKMAFIEEASRL